MTDEELNRLVLEQARQRVAANRQTRAEELQPRRPAPQPVRDDRAGLWAFLGLLLTLLIGTLVLLPGTFVDRLGWIVHGVCAQEHTLVIAGVEMPLCQRNTGIYSGFLASLLTLIALGRGRATRMPPRSISLLLLFNVLWMGVDGFNSLLKDIGGLNLYEPQPVLRILSGLAMGMTVATLLLYAFNLSLRSNARREQRVIKSWGEVALIFGVELALFALIQLNTSLLIYPLAIFSTLGIIGVMFVVNLIVVAMIARYEGAVLRVVQLARPAMVALVLTGAEFGLLAWARIALENSMNM